MNGGFGIGGELPTYDEAVAEGLETHDVGNERRGHFEIEGQHSSGAESWDADEKKWQFTHGGAVLNRKRTEKIHKLEY